MSGKKSGEDLYLVSIKYEYICISVNMEYTIRVPKKDYLVNVLHNTIAGFPRTNPSQPPMIGLIENDHLGPDNFEFLKRALESAGFKDVFLLQMANEELTRLAL